VREFIEAANLLREGCPNVKFILVGPVDVGSEDVVPEVYLREQEKQNNNFIWTGFRSDVKTFYALSEIAVLPTYYREGGYPKTLTEPMAMGKPLITTNSVHCRATVEEGKNGFIVPIKDSEALARAIEKLISDNNQLTEFGKYSRQKALDELDEKKIIPQVVKKMFDGIVF
jgi:glycosyltransferase involved in cell wall biosynthesis